MIDFFVDIWDASWGPTWRQYTPRRAQDWLGRAQDAPGRRQDAPGAARSVVLGWDFIGRFVDFF